VSCNNVGDERLVAALESAPPLPSNLVGDALQDVIDNRALALPGGMSDKEYQDRVAHLTKAVIGEVGERAMAKVLANAGHYVFGDDVDTHAPGEGSRRANDFTTIAPDSSLNVFEVKTTASGAQAARTNEYGGRNLSRPRLSRTVDGRKQLDDTYNLVRMVDLLTFDGDAPAHGEGAQSYAVKVDLSLMTYQLFEVNADGRVLGSVGPQLSAAAEIAEALREVHDEAGQTWP
jgi:hypothetical protein